MQILIQYFLAISRIRSLRCPKVRHNGLHSFIKRATIRQDGIRDASGLSTSELGRFTRLERDRATSASNRPYSLFGLTFAPRMIPSVDRII